MSACMPTYMLASGLIDEGMNWWQADPHHLPGQPDRARADGAQRPRRHQVRHSVSGLLPAVVRHPRRECAGAACGRSWPAAGSASKPGSAARRFTRSSPHHRQEFYPAWQPPADIALIGINASQLGCFLFFWAINMLVIYKGIESIRILLEHQGAAADRPRPRAVGLGLLRGRAASAKCSRSRRSSLPADRRPGSSGRSSSLADRQRRLLGHALAQHPRLQPLRLLPARPGTRARRSACRRRWRCTRSSASPSLRPPP